MSSTTIHWERILLGGLLAEVALILAIIPLGLRLGDNFLLLAAGGHGKSSRQGRDN